MANLLERRKRRSTGTVVSVVRGQLDEGSPELRYWTICEDHGGIVGHALSADARGWAVEPECWCPTCQGDAS